MSVCAVIPAAGRGSRLGLDQPKLLASVTEQGTIWTLLRGRLEGLVDRIHVIVSPAGLEAFQRALDDGSDGVPVSIGIQPQPIGMGDAIFCGYPVWSRADILLVVWGDQIHVSKDTLQAGLTLHHQAEKCVVLPLVALPDPYVEYRFDGMGRLVAVLQNREGDGCRPGGLCDVGVFILSTTGLGDEWSRFLQEDRRGTLTGEINFLPFLVFLAQRAWEVKPLGVADSLEARGINTPEDLDFFRAIYGLRATTD